MQWKKGHFSISDESELSWVSRIVQLHHQVYDSAAYSEEETALLLKNCFWLVLFHDKKLIGFIRAITDKATSTYCLDVIIDKGYRRQGHGRWMMNCFLEHRDISKTYVVLGTQTADEFFQKFDFCQRTLMHRPPSPPTLAAPE